MRADARYPDDETLLAWAEEISYSELAKKCGVRRESLRDYLRIRPELKARIDAVKKQRLSPEQAKANDLAAKRRWRKNNPDRVREINRRWAKNQSREQRRKWNLYNASRRRNSKSEWTAESHEYADFISRDSCAFFWLCGNQATTLDHIIAIVNDGDNYWTNFAPLCHSCNSSKNDQDVLQFMLRRLNECG